MKDRLRLIKNLRAKRMSYRAIGKLLGISGQRVQQIEIGYKAKKPHVPPEEHKIWTAAKRASLGLPTDNLMALGINGGRDSVRELIRIRDNHTCQMCLTKWKPGTRRFDVHHQDERQEGSSFRKHSGRRDKKAFDSMITLCHRCHLNLDSVKRKTMRGTRRAKQLTTAEKQKVVMMIQSGNYLLKDIARKFGVSTMLISQYNRRLAKVA